MRALLDCGDAPLMNGRAHPTAMSFLQSPPQLDNQYREDRLLVGYLRRTVPADLLRTLEPSLDEMGELAAGELYRQQLAEVRWEPRLERWDAWGRRIDRIEVTPLWRRAEEIAARSGLVALAYERPHGRFSRAYQFALVHLFTPSTDIYSCPLAMTDGAARTLVDSGNAALIERAVPHLTSRDPAQFWTSGQWMTETTGGSDVGRSETEARRDGEGWRLYGRKWFTSATTSPMALTLARPEGNPPGGRGLALFYLETRGPDGSPDGVLIERLKDKLGTRKVPTAELTLDGARAVPVRGLTDGVRNIAPMLNVTRTWNAVSAVALMRRAVALARDYADRRSAFGAPLSSKPLHLDTLAELQAQAEGAFHLAFRVVEILGAVEGGEIDPGGRALLRLLTPVAKLTTARQAVTVTSEALEAFGGAGYIEDTGLPLLLRDAQVLPIWEGTTNVLALDVLRVLSDEGTRAALEAEVAHLVIGAGSGEPAVAAAAGAAAVRSALRLLRETAESGPDASSAAARRIALGIGRGLEVLLAARHASWALAESADPRPLAAARRLAWSLRTARDEPGLDETRVLATDRLEEPAGQPVEGATT